MPYLLTAIMIMNIFLSLPAHQQATVPAPAPGTSTDITIGDIAIWRGLSDKKVHTVAVYKSGRASKPFIVAFGVYMNPDDVNVSLVNNSNGTWSGYIAEVNATVTVGWNGNLVRVSVDTGTVQSEEQYLAPCRYIE